MDISYHINTHKSVLVLIPKYRIGLSVKGYHLWFLQKNRYLQNVHSRSQIPQVKASSPPVKLSFSASASLFFHLVYGR